MCHVYNMYKNVPLGLTELHILVMQVGRQVQLGHILTLNQPLLP